MARKDFSADDWVKVTISNENVRYKSGDIAMGLFDKHMKAIETFIKSSTNAFEYFNNKLKTIERTANGDIGKQSMYVRRSALPDVESSIDFARGKIENTGGTTGVYTVTTEDVIPLTFKRKRAGTLSQSQAIEATLSTPNMEKAYFASEKDKANEMMTFHMFVDKAEYASFGSDKVANKHYSKMVNNILKEFGSTKSSSQVTKRRAEVEAERKAKEEAKEAERRAKEEEAQKRKEENEAKASHRSAMRAWTAILTILTLIANITRRILTAVLDRGSELKKQAVTATELQMPAKTVREAEFVERSAGVSKGAYVGGVKDIQSAFGDITAIDDGKLKILAPFMGGAVEDFVRSGMGGKDGEKLMKMIIDSAFKTAMSGKNSLGQDVGVADAVRNFTTVLNKISPHVAEMFSAMAYDNMYGLNRGAVGNFDDWWNLNNKRHSWEWDVFDTEKLRLLGQMTDQLAGAFSKLSKYIEESLLSKLDKLLAWLNSLDIGKTANEKLDDRGVAYAKVNAQLVKVARTGALAEEQMYKSAEEAGLTKEEVDIILNDKYDDLKYPQMVALHEKLRAPAGINFYRSAQLFDQAVGLKAELDDYKKDLENGDMPAMLPQYFTDNAVSGYKFRYSPIPGVDADVEAARDLGYQVKAFYAGGRLHPFISSAVANIINRGSGDTEDQALNSYTEDLQKDILSLYDATITGDWSFSSLVQHGGVGKKYIGKGRERDDETYPEFLAMAGKKLANEILPSVKNGNKVSDTWGKFATAVKSKDFNSIYDALSELYSEGAFSEEDLLPFKFKAIPDSYKTMGGNKLTDDIKANNAFINQAIEFISHDKSIEEKLYPEWKNKYADVRFNATMNKDSRTLTIKVQGYNAKGEKVAEQTVFSNESVDYGENRESDLGNIFN